MKERPILFQPEMVRAILEGRKTQTRRIVKHQHDAQFIGAAGDSKTDPRNWGWLDEAGEACTLVDGGEGDAYAACPYGVPGDRLWVREGLRWVNNGGEPVERGHVYAATPDVWVEPLVEYEALPMRSIPSIHMPRWASRLTLEVVSVRVERLQAITLKDCADEGAPPTHVADNIWDSTSTYRAIWEKINGPGSWAANPWVWVVEFKRKEAANGKG